MPTLAELESEIATLQERLRVTSALAVAMREYDATVGVKAKEASGMIIRRRVRPAPSMGPTEQVARDLMLATGAPVGSSVVVEEMRRQGIAVPAKNPINVISARLSNNPKFQGRRGVGYWFADRNWPGDTNQDPLGFNENGPPIGNPGDGPDTALAAQ